MVRTSYSAMILAAAAALVMAGCGKEDLTDLQDNWTKKEGDVIAKLTEVQNKNRELHTKFETVKATNTTDTNKIADRTIAETMLGDHDTQIGDIEKTIASLKAKRDSAAVNGKRADFEAAWKAAETEYDAALAKITSLDNQNGEIGNKIDGLAGAGAGTTATIDTVAVATPDTAAKAMTKTDDKKPAEDASKVAEKTDDKKTAEGEKTEKKDDKKEVSK